MTSTTQKIAGLDTLSFKKGNKRAVILLHGFGAGKKDLSPLAGFLDPQESRDWYFPNGPLDLGMPYPAGASAWFPIDMAALEQAMQSGTHREFKDKCPQEFLDAAEMVGNLLDELKKDYDEVVLGGFSQGAMVATEVAMNKTDKIVSLLILSGTFLAESRWSKNLSQLPFPIFQSHGKEDPVLGHSQAVELNKLLTSQNNKVEFLEFDGGHEIPMNVLQAMGKYI